MAYFIPATLTATVVASMAVLSNAPHHEAARPPEFQDEALIEDARSWTLINQVTKSACKISKTKRVSQWSSLIEVDPTCSDTKTGSDLYKVWQISNNNVITFADGQGNTVAEFVREGDSVTFSNQKISLTPNG